MTSDHVADDVPDEWGPEDRRKHLDFIQAAIARMAGGSAVAKGWALTIATATFGYAGTKGSILVCILGILAVLLFAAVDTKYLQLERGFVLLYEGARIKRVAVYDMAGKAFKEEATVEAKKRLSARSAFWSWSVVGYYGCIATVGIILFGWLIARPTVVAIVQWTERAATCAC